MSQILFSRFYVISALLLVLLYSMQVMECNKSTPFRHVKYKDHVGEGEGEGEMMLQCQLVGPQYSKICYNVLEGTAVFGIREYVISEYVKTRLYCTNPASLFWLVLFDPQLGQYSASVICFVLFLTIIL